MLPLFNWKMNVSEHFTLLARKRDCESYEIFSSNG